MKRDIALVVLLKEKDIAKLMHNLLSNGYRGSNIREKETGECLLVLHEFCVWDMPEIMSFMIPSFVTKDDQILLEAKEGANIDGEYVTFVSGVDGLKLTPYYPEKSTLETEALFYGQQFYVATQDTKRNGRVDKIAITISHSEISLSKKKMFEGTENECRKHPIFGNMFFITNLKLVPLDKKGSLYQRFLELI